MAAYKPGDTFWETFCTQNPTSGAITDATGTPVASMVHNGTIDGTVTLTVAKIATGTYTITGTIPAGYAAGDKIQVTVTATVSSVAGGNVVHSSVLDSKRLADGVTVSGNVTVGGYAAGEDPATLVLDASASSHNTANSIGAKINTAASAGDPWATGEPGSYASGTFGNLVATALTSTTSWIFAAASYVSPPLPAALGTPRQIANTPYTKTFTQNCLRTAIADQLVDSSTNSPINLTGSTVEFEMISQVDKSVKINNAAATITDGPNGKVAYSWTGTDLDTPGLYWGWWIVTTNGKTEKFPGDGEKMTVKVVAAE